LALVASISARVASVKALVSAAHVVHIFIGKCTLTPVKSAERDLGLTSLKSHPFYTKNTILDGLSRSTSSGKPSIRIPFLPSEFIMDE
jgi:hypothetical protein